MAQPQQHRGQGEFDEAHAIISNMPLHRRNYTQQASRVIFRKSTSEASGNETNGSTTKCGNSTSDRTAMSIESHILARCGNARLAYYDILWSSVLWSLRHTKGLVPSLLDGTIKPGELLDMPRQATMDLDVLKDSRSSKVTGKGRATTDVDSRESSSRQASANNESLADARDEDTHTTDADAALETMRSAEQTSVLPPTAQSPLRGDGDSGGPIDADPESLPLGQQVEVYDPYASAAATRLSVASLLPSTAVSQVA